MPRVLPQAQKQEMAARDEQVSEYDANLPLTLLSLVEIPLTLSRLEVTSNHRLLEAGCGTGRMTPKLAQSAGEVVAVDFSLASLRENAIKLQTTQVTNVHLIQGDLCHLPLKSDQFDRAVSCQVLEHVPTPDLRNIAVAEIARSVKPGANIVISAYQHSRWTQDKEGEHEGGIPYFRFTRDEFADLLGTQFAVEFDRWLARLHLSGALRAGADLKRGRGIIRTLPASLRGRSKKFPRAGLLRLLPLREAGRVRIY